eukprot:3641384-Rhodomonas_salina.2
MPKDRDARQCCYSFEYSVQKVPKYDVGRDHEWHIACGHSRPSSRTPRMQLQRCVLRPRSKE